MTDLASAQSAIYAHWPEHVGIAGKALACLMETRMEGTRNNRVTRRQWAKRARKRFHYKYREVDAAQKARGEKVGFGWEALLIAVLIELAKWLYQWWKDRQPTLQQITALKAEAEAA